MYFDQCGKDNTLKAVELVLKAAKKSNIKNIVVASCSGETVQLFKNTKDFNIVCVTHVNGFKEAGKSEMSLETRSKLLENNYKLLTTTHVLSGAERGISRNFSGAYPVEIIAHTLRMLGQGIKVCVEVSVMALDAGLIPYGEPIIAVGGTGTGADSAIILTPSHASSIFDTKIHEVICKPL